MPSYISSKYVLLIYFENIFPNTTSYYKACTKHIPLLFCIIKLAQSTAQYYFVLEGEAFIQRSLYTEKLLHREAFTQRNFYINKFLYTETFTQIRDFFAQRSIRTQQAFTHRKLLHTEFFIQRSFYTQKLLHTELFTRRSFYTKKLHTEKLLHGEIFIQRNFYTQHAFRHGSFYRYKLLHRTVFAHDRAWNYSSKTRWSRRPDRKKNRFLKTA